MILIDKAEISNIALHRVASGQRSVINDRLLEPQSDEEMAILRKLFLKPFAQHAQTFEFAHSIDLEYNVLYGLARDIYEGNADFQSLSAKVARHLIECSQHPNINEGELFIMRFGNLLMGETAVKGLGIYKFEDKDTFIETSVEHQDAGIVFRRGFGGKKPDKACLVLFTPPPYTLLVIDNNSGETDYWQKEFINHKIKNDDINSTHQVMALAKDFITEKIAADFEVTTTDRIDLLNRSVAYFKNHDRFDKEEFEEEVFSDPQVIASFRDYGAAYGEENDWEIADSFDISQQAVKKQARAFKSVLKLDKNFHIYIHGDRELIERGVDEDGRKFYKIYYDEEQ